VKNIPLPELKALLLIAERNTADKVPFEVAVSRCLSHEGGYVNDINDPGGETNWGISKRSYPDLDIARLTRDDAIAIYKRDFWDAVKADGLPSSVVFQLFDFAINSGVNTAIRYFQRAIGVADDGYWGSHSQSVADSTSETDMLLGINAERLDFMRRLKNWKYYGAGWAARVAENLRHAKTDNLF
jgi:lysozyme family protein